MGLLEKIINKVENHINPEQYKFDVVQGAQMELIRRAGGDDIAGTWIDVNGAVFRQIVDNPAFDYIERLGNENTRDSAIVEIENKLIPLHTIH